jgi:hypothetical protein
MIQEEEGGGSEASMDCGVGVRRCERSDLGL